jgi:tripartite ATP-independent transporter DctM subunit
MVELILISVFFVLLFMGVPVAFAFGLATIAALCLSINEIAALTTVAQRMAGGINSFALLAIPLFILSGQLMSSGGIAQRLVHFARCLIGMLPGGLAFVNVVSCTLFGSISGSAVAATSSVGGVMVPAMEEEHYPREFSAALTATAATTGLLIPPSNILIVYAVASGGVSVAALFVAGYLPGLLVALALMGVCAVYARRRGLTGTAFVGFAELLRSFIAAAPSLLLLVIIIGGILAGVFTATEAGAIAVLYALALSLFYGETTLIDLPPIFLKATSTTAIVMLLIGTSMAMSWLFAFEGIPGQVADLLLNLSDNPLVILLLINLILLLVGAFMDMTPAVLIFTPIFLPVAVQLDMSPLHFGIMMVLNLSIGLCTPPVGSVLFVSCAVAKTKIEAMIRPLLPMYLAMMAALLLVTYVPAMSEALPIALGLYE